MSFNNCSAEISPNIGLVSIFSNVILRIAAYRTRKNSSKLFEKIPKNLNLSNNGTFSSAASCNTLALNANQLFSLSMYGFILFVCSVYLDVIVSKELVLQLN